MPDAKNITDLTGRVAVVIGGTGGLGKAIAVGLAESGADVVPTGRRKELVDKACAVVAKHGRRTLAYEVDVASRASIDQLRDAVLKEFGRVDILVNAAGRTVRKQAKDISEEDWHAVMDTN